jgi:hypothetical protein
VKTFQCWMLIFTEGERKGTLVEFPPGVVFTHSKEDVPKFIEQFKERLGLSMSVPIGAIRVEVTIREISEGEA